MKIGILGGTFDPIHLGHLRTAEEVGEALGLKKVYLIPSASPPHKTGEPVTPFFHRLEMTRIATDESPLLEALDLEGKRPGLSYSIETLKELCNTLGPECDLYFILGTDAFIEIETWKEYYKLFDYAHFVVIRRAGHEVISLEPFLISIREDIKKTALPDIYVTGSNKNVIIMSSTLMEISSTHIRREAARGRSIRFLVPHSVGEYITRKGLYLNHAGAR
ncbi:putative nicotinate-nucleotide adenylyltransferase [uncultured Desulfobacterium sp.]|uniref:Probable nicotinate-nucleotide adenylyltransferase n=1 Tax=uncultured Desulfobacterium sp. TaxID=201089 RepID=A0A445N1G8_9BACT|nr:putative nicotinate-nucleotide adenylyltransferase [uncultured Desulfobacterium sp.]